MNKSENMYAIKMEDNAEAKLNSRTDNQLFTSLDNSPPINRESKSSLTVLIHICQSLVAKRAPFIYLIITHTPDIVIGSESWLKSSIKDHEIFPAGYAGYHHDHADGYSGIIRYVST